MNFTEVTIQGTLNPDGTLQLDEKPNLPPGRVTVVLRQQPVPDLPRDDPFWQRMRILWDAQKAAGHVPRSSQEIAAEREQEREEWENHQLAIERLQEEGGMPRASTEAPKQ